MELTSYLLGRKAGGGGGSGDVSEYFDTKISNNTSSSEYLALIDIVKKAPPFTVDENVTSLSYCFRYWPLPEVDVSQMNMTNITSAEGMFNNATQLLHFDGSSFVLENTQSINSMFEGCTKLITIDLSKMTLRQEYAYTRRTSTTFKNCYKLAKLDISSLDFSTPWSTFTNMFQECGTQCLQSDGAYADGIPYIYVKDATAQNWILNAGNGRPSSWSTANVVIKNQ